MTLDEARAIGAVIAHADGGCRNCIEALCERLNGAVLGFRWGYNKNAPGIPEPPENCDYETWTKWRDADLARYVTVEATP